MATTRARDTIAVECLEVSACTIPTDAPESDGTQRWAATTLVVVEALGGGLRGLGYTYADTATARLIADTLADVVVGRDALAVPGTWAAMVGAVRNLGRPGIASMAIAAVEAALWDVKARLLDLPLAALLGTVREGVPVYGSGGFTSYSLVRLREQLGGWVAGGIPRVKMKVGRDPAADRERVRAARDAIGPDAALFVDANGAYDRKEALVLADTFAACGVSWFEEPASSDDLDGLRLLCDRAPAGMRIAAGEHGYDLPHFRRMLDAGAVDVLQADATRCSGITGFLRVGALCEAYALPLSAHTAPMLHLHPCRAVAPVLHLEYFHDHVRIENLLFDGVVGLVAGEVRPDWSRPGLGLELKRAASARYAVCYPPSGRWPGGCRAPRVLPTARINVPNGCGRERRRHDARRGTVRGLSTRRAPRRSGTIAGRTSGHLTGALVRDVALGHRLIRTGRFGRSLALVAGFSGLLSGLEVAYEHYRGSYSQRVMYTPVILGAALTVAGVWGALSRRAARTVLPVVSLLTLADGLIGFGFHLRGIARKPGGWRLPTFNLIMGPPIFAPLLFALGGYLGLLAAFLRREDDSALALSDHFSQGHLLARDVRAGRFQRQLAAVAGISALCSGFEALYSHYKNDFRYPAQWTPVVIAPLLGFAGLGAVASRRIAHTLLPIVSILALLDGTIGFGYHLRGILRRPGGLKLPFYNLIYGPPLFAPLLLAASGFLGLLASLLRRED